MVTSPEQRLRAFKASNQKIAALTAYDYPGAKLLDQAGIDLLLVGDSLGMVILGYEDTTEVTLADILHHLRAVRRGTENALLVADLPFGTYPDKETALENSRQLIEAGAEFVKLEGGTAQAETVQHIVQAGIPIVGHIGMLPQQVKVDGGYKKKGKTPEAAAILLQDAKDLQAAGACALVIESTKAPVATEITQAISIPTIGIGSGFETDGQILVTHDLLGSFPWFCPPFAVTRAKVAEDTTNAAKQYLEAVRAGKN